MFRQTYTHLPSFRGAAGCWWVVTLFSWGHSVSPGIYFPSLTHTHTHTQAADSPQPVTMVSTLCSHWHNSQTDLNDSDLEIIAIDWSEVRPVLRVSLSREKANV